MKAETRTDSTAIVITDPADRPVLEEHLRDHAIGEPRWFALGDLDDLDRAVRRGHVHRVIARDASSLLAGVWEQEIVLAKWPAETRIEFVESPGGEIEFRRIARGWQEWHHVHRRRQALAGAVVSLLSLAIAFTLCVWLAS